jgi:hypothetical protein
MYVDSDVEPDVTKGDGTYLNDFRFVAIVDIAGNTIRNLVGYYHCNFRFPAAHSDGPFHRFT